MSEQIGTRIELEIGAIAHGGHCVARYDGRVYFVRHTLPGERVVAEVTEDKGGAFARADAVEVLRAAPQRTTPACRYSGPGGCGGCDFQHVTPEYQREMKAGVITEQLARVGRLTPEHITALQILVAPLTDDATGWRTRVQFVAGPDGRLGLRQHRSHQVVEVASCAIAHREVNRAPALAESWPPESQVEIATDSSGNTSVLATQPGARRGGTTLVAGSRYLVEHAANRWWRVRAGGFWQVHSAAADALIEAVVALAAPRAGDRILDLYAGAGLFAGALAGELDPGGDSTHHPAGSVTAVESDRAAVADARRNLRDLPHVQVVSGKVEKVLAVERGLGIDVVVLDPPRAGAGKSVVELIAATGPRAVVYVACDPAALARDVAYFASLGYRLCELRAFDAFPMTHHVECVALFTPGG